jgi:SAM-dependent methyltransferase
MKKKSYKQYIGEVENWLHRGRRRLLETNLKLGMAALAVEGKPLRILEVGAGSGRNISILEKFGVVDAVEIEPMALEYLRENPGVSELFSRMVPFELAKKYDLICAMDFLEHVENDQQVFDWMVEHLADNGVMFVTVPAYQFLFSSHDVALEHYRRYRVGDLLALNGQKLSLIKKGYFNCILFPLAALSRVMERLKSSGAVGQAQEKQRSSVHPWLDKLFFGILNLEVSLLAKLPLFPFGLTAFALFRK